MRPPTSSKTFAGARRLLRPTTWPTTRPTATARTIRATSVIPVTALLLLATAHLVADTHATITVDFTAEGSPVNRALFSWVNYQRFYSEADETARSLFDRLNPAGTVARTEVMIDRIEPANDDDDPTRFNWNRLHPDRMYRFVDVDGPAFLDTMRSLGMDPLALLTYNVEWLGRGGRRDAPPRDNAEWAEFAAAVLEASAGGIDAVEVWNEPSPGGPYWSGSREDYFALFEAVAERLDRDYPGTEVGGPAVLSSDGGFMLEFIERCGERADFFTMHFYNEDPVRMARRISDWSRYIADQTGKAAALHVTESDNWNLTGWAKIDYVMTRQFELVARASEIGSFHHFSLPYYRESPGRVFGLLHPDGRPVAENYLPYYLFRNYAGDAIPTTVVLSGAVVDATVDHRSALPIYAAAARIDEGALSVIVHAHDRSIAGAELDLTLPPGPEAWTVRVEHLAPPTSTSPSPANHGDFGPTTTHYERVAASGRLSIPIDLAVGPAAVVTIVAAGSETVDVAIDTASSVVSVFGGAQTVVGDIWVKTLPSGEETLVAAEVSVGPAERVDIPIALSTIGRRGDTHTTAIFVPRAEFGRGTETGRSESGSAVTAAGEGATTRPGADVAAGTAILQGESVVAVPRP